MTLLRMSQHLQQDKSITVEFKQTVMIPQVQ